jgi:hypothetical protein
MHKILFSVSIPIFFISIYFLSIKEECFDVTQYRENIYTDNNGRLMDENIPVVVTVNHSTHALGFGLTIIGACVFLSGIYLYSKKTATSENVSTNSIT